MGNQFQIKILWEPQINHQYKHWENPKRNQSQQQQQQQQHHNDIYIFSGTQHRLRDNNRNINHNNRRNVPSPNNKRSNNRYINHNNRRNVSSPNNKLS